MTCGSIFSGIGGFELGLEWSGLVTKTLWQVEIDSFCKKILAKHWPNSKRYGDIRDVGKHNLEPVDIICGGDPCPVRSKARGNRPTKHPDLSGYFLSVVGGLRPQWVLRENVPASDDVNFITALEILGYRTVVIRANSAPYTGQNRKRDFIVGSFKSSWPSKAGELYIRHGSLRVVEARNKTSEGYPCLTTHCYRYDAHDGYIWNGTGKIRIADFDERTKLSGFPAEWLEGLSKTRVGKLTGNAVVPQVSMAIGTIIKQFIDSGDATR